MDIKEFNQDKHYQSKKFEKTIKGNIVKRLEKQDNVSREIRRQMSELQDTKRELSGERAYRTKGNQYTWNDNAAYIARLDEKKHLKKECF